ncbi:MAG: hypothetical protein KDI51_18195, partial [Xanthomonadales bacterium]|nr:hypothetical protein [Xanthomonadales bacterium]
IAPTGVPQSCVLPIDQSFRRQRTARHAFEKQLFSTLIQYLAINRLIVWQANGKAGTPAAIQSLQLHSNGERP